MNKYLSIRWLKLAMAKNIPRKHAQGLRKPYNWDKSDDKPLFQLLFSLNPSESRPMSAKF